jgi:CubicO group peptidase (beta-lactamase class C family)
MTATGVMVQVEKGELELGAPVNRYLRDGQLVAHAGDVEQATVRRLSNHTSGLQRHTNFFYADEPVARPEFSESLRRYGVVMAEPGARFEYSNFGYGVLGHLLEQTSGLTYSDFMRQEVFLPLGMNHTRIELGEELAAFAAVPYAADLTPLPARDFDHPGASAVYSSAHDLVRFGMFHLEQGLPDAKAIVSRRTVQEMQKPTADVGDGRQYGIGWYVDADEHGLQTVSHTGGMPGARCRLTLIPAHGIVVAAVCNYRHDLPLELTREILATLLPDYGQRMRTASRHTPNAQPSPPGCPPELVGYWAGWVQTYTGQRRLELWAHPDGDVRVRLNGGLITLLNDTRLAGGVLSGLFDSDLDTPDVGRKPYHLQLRLTVERDLLRGPVTAESIASARGGYTLSYWAQLHKEDSDPQLVALFNGKDLSGWRVTDQDVFSRHGAVRVEGDSLILGQGNPASGIPRAGDPPRWDYEISLDAKRVAGSDFFCGMTFPVGERYLTLIIGGWGGGVMGLSNLDGMSAVENETTGYKEFQQDRWYRIRLQVTRQAVSIWLDEEQIIDVDLTDRRLGIWWEVEPSRPLGIATWYTRAALRRIHLKRLPAEAVP